MEMEDKSVIYAKTNTFFNANNSNWIKDEDTDIYYNIRFAKSIELVRKYKMGDE